MNQEFVRVTFTVPKYIVESLDNHVEKGKKSHFVAEALQYKLAQVNFESIKKKDAFTQIKAVRKALKKKYTTKEIIDFISEDRK